MKLKLCILVFFVTFTFINVNAQTNSAFGLLLEVFTVDKTIVPHHEHFTVTINLRNRGTERFDGGQMGAALVDNRGNITEVIGNRNAGGIGVGNRYSNPPVMNNMVSHTVTPGQYRLQIVVRISSNDEWQIVTQSSPDIPNSINIEVTANNNIVVAPLLRTRWCQRGPYNNLFPHLPNHPRASPNGRLWTDCGTTAMVQIMAFHRHPARGSGESSIIGPHNVNVPRVNLNVAYDWDNMLNTYPDANSGTERQQNAVATLMYHVALLRGMEGSFISNFISLFRYDRGFQIRYRRFYTDAEWRALIRQQLDAGLPVYYYGNYPTDVPSSTGYHASVVDGYDNADRFHINWGWNGDRDGWYCLNNTDPKATPESYINEHVYINIKPDAGSVGSNEFGLESFTASKTSVSQNEMFTVTPTIRSFGFFPGGQVGAALVDNNGNIAAVIGIREIGNNWNPGTRAVREMNCFVPETVRPGQYRLMTVTRTQGGSWKTVTVSDISNRVPNAINLTVTAERGAPGGGHGLALMHFSVNQTTVARNASFTVNVQPRNIDISAFLGGQLGAVLVDNNGNIVAELGNRNISALNPGSRFTAPFVLNCTVPNTVTPGRYQLRVVIRPTGGEWRVATLSQDNAPTSIDFTVR